MISSVLAAPVISSITDAPDPILQGENVTITADSTDGTGIDSVWTEIASSNYSMNPGILSTTATLQTNGDTGECTFIGGTTSGQAATSDNTRSVYEGDQCGWTIEDISDSKFANVNSITVYVEHVSETGVATNHGTIFLGNSGTTNVYGSVSLSVNEGNQNKLENSQGSAVTGEGTDSYTGSSSPASLTALNDLVVRVDHTDGNDAIGVDHIYIVVNYSYYSDTYSTEYNTTNLLSGNHNYQIHSNNTGGELTSSSVNQFTVYSQPAYWSINETNIQKTYSPVIESEFNITWQDDLNINQVFFESNFSGLPQNYSMNNILTDIFNYSFIFPAGYFYWISWGRDSAGQWNSTDTWDFSIDKAQIGMEILTNDSVDKITLNVSFDAKISCNTSLSNAGNISIFLNDEHKYSSSNNLAEYTHTFGIPGEYNASCQLSHQNYTSINSTIISAVDYIPPVITNHLPIDNFWNDSSDPYLVRFNCSITDNYNLKNFSLYLTDGNNQSFSLNESITISGNYANEERDIPIGNGNYTWNCLGYDTWNNSVWGSNRTIMINYTAPPSDNDLPYFGTASVDKFIMSSGEQARFKIPIYDDTSLIDYVNGSVNGGTYDFTNSYSNYEWYYDYTCVASKKFVNFSYIGTNDSFGNWNETSITGVFAECDAKAPEINFAFINYSTPVIFNNVIKVNASIIDIEDNLNEVWLEIDSPHQNPYNTTVAQNGNEFYNDTINLSETGIYVFKFYAIDLAGNVNVTTAQDLLLNNYIEAVDYTPSVVTLVGPEDNFYSDNKLPFIEFNCSATENDNLENISLWITNKHNTSFELNASETVRGRYNDSNWNIQFENGNYTWNCLAQDEYNNLGWGINRSFVVDFVAHPPDVFLTAPPNASVITITNDVSFNVTYMDEKDSAENCTLYTNISGVWSVESTKLYSGQYDSQLWDINNIDNGTYIWNAECYDNNSNAGWNATNYTFSVSYDPFLDNELPVINNINISPNIVKSNENITILANITDNFDITVAQVEINNTRFDLNRLTTTTIQSTTINISAAERGECTTTWPNNIVGANSSDDYRILFSGGTCGWDVDNIVDSGFLNFESITVYVEHVAETGASAGSSTVYAGNNAQNNLYGSQILTSRVSNDYNNLGNAEGLSDPTEGSDSFITSSIPASLSEFNDLIIRVGHTDGNDDLGVDHIYLVVNYNKTIWLDEWNFNYNVTTLDEGEHEVRIYANDTSYLEALVKTEKFYVYNALYPVNSIFSPNIPTSYSLSNNYIFNITWQGTFPPDTVMIEHNFFGSLTNYSTVSLTSTNYSYLTTGIMPGNKTWKFYANDSFGSVFNSSTKQITVINNTINTTENITIIEDVEIDWAPIENTDNYTIYYTNDLSQSFQVLESGIKDSNWTDPTADTASERYYMISSNVQGVEFNTTKIIGKKDYTNTNNWSLVSIPFDLQDWAFNNNTYSGLNIHSEPENCIQSIYRYDENSECFSQIDNYDGEWYAASGCDNFNGNSLEKSRGYWFLFNESCQITFIGEVTNNSINYNLKQGYNIVGWKSTNSPVLPTYGEPPAYPIEVTPADSVFSIMRYNEASQAFEKTNHFSAWGWWPATGSESFTTIEPLRSYYFENSEDSTWSYVPQ